MKRIILMIVFTLMLNGCNTSDEVRAERIAKKYLYSFYDTTELDLDYRCIKVECSFDNEIYRLEQIDSYVTSEFKKAILKNRRVSVLYRLSYDFDTRLKLSRYELVSNPITENSITFNYIIDVELIEYDKIITEIEGELTINKVGDKWVVTSESNSAKKRFVEFMSNEEN